MTSFTDRLGLIKQAYGTNPETWGTELNNAVIDLVDDAIAYEPITVNSDVTLSADDGLENQARRYLLVFTGDGGHTVTVKDVDRWYLVYNKCAADVTIKPDGGTGSDVRAGTCVLWTTNGTTSETVDVSLDKIAKPLANVDFNGKKIVNLSDAELGTHEAAPISQVEAMLASATVNLPSQIGHNGGALATDGTTPFWDMHVARLNEVQEWSGAQRPSVTELSVASGSIAWTLASGNDYSVTLTANATLALPSDIATHVGQKGRILITQDSTGSRTFAVDEDIVPLGSEDVPEIPTDPGAMAYFAYDVISETQIVFTLTGVGE